MKILCFFRLHKWVLFKKELYQYQSLTGLQPTIIFHYGCNGCGKTRTETREEGYWHTLKPSDLEHM